MRRVDGTYQACKAKGGAYVRKEFFGKYPETAKLVEDMTDEEIGKLRRGGHDPTKVYNAYKAAVEYKGGPTVVLAKTVKGYGMGDAGKPATSRTAEGTQREGHGVLPRPLRDSGSGRSRPRRRVLQSAGEQSRDGVHA